MAPHVFVATGVIPTTCPICGGKMCKGSIMCNTCRSYKKRKCIRPDVNTLIEEVSSSSFVSVGKKYGVSDNAIRKWLVDYGINPKTLGTL